MSITVAVIVFGVIFVAELPDKTALASLVLGTRYRPLYVFAGVAAAFLLHVVLAITAGSLLGLLPHRVVEAVVAALFLAGAVLMLFHREEGEPGGEQAEAADVAAVAARTGRAGGAARRAVMTSFTVVLVAEFGDLTQIVTANLAAKYHDPVSVGVGAVLGLWAVAAVAVTGGRTLLRVVPMVWIIRVAAAVMVVMSGISVYEAVRG